MYEHRSKPKWPMCGRRCSWMSLSNEMMGWCSSGTNDTNDKPAFMDLIPVIFPQSFMFYFCYNFRMTSTTRDTFEVDLLATKMPSVGIHVSQLHGITTKTSMSMSDTYKHYGILHARAHNQIIIILKREIKALLSFPISKNTREKRCHFFLSVDIFIFSTFLKRRDMGIWELSE